MIAASGCEGAIVAPYDSAQSGGPVAGAAGSGSPSTPAPNAASPSPTDMQMRAQNPTLFDHAMRYFPTPTAAAGSERLFRLTRVQLDVTTQTLLPSYYASAASEVMPRDPLQTN
ncbi:MAG: hypothetical protein ABW321_18670, partial [Polyangiales bacterium]